MSDNSKKIFNHNKSLLIGIAHQILSYHIFNGDDLTKNGTKRINFSFSNKNHLQKFYEYFELEQYKKEIFLNDCIIKTLNEVRQGSYKDRNNSDLIVNSLYLFISKYISKKRHGYFKAIDTQILLNIESKLKCYLESLNNNSNHQLQNNKRKNNDDSLNENQTKQIKKPKTKKEPLPSTSSKTQIINSTSLLV